MESKLKQKFEEWNDLNRLLFRNKWHQTGSVGYVNIQILCQRNENSLKDITDSMKHMDTLWRYVQCEDPQYNLRKEQALTVLFEIAQRCKLPSFKVTFDPNQDSVSNLIKLLSPSTNIQHTKLAISLLTIWMNTTQPRNTALKRDILQKLTDLCHPNTDFEILTTISMYLHQCISNHEFPSKQDLNTICSNLNFLLIYSQCEILWMVLSSYIRLIQCTQMNAIDILKQTLDTNTPKVRKQIENTLNMDHTLVYGVIQKVQESVSNIIPTGINQLILRYLNPFGSQKMPQIHMNPISKIVMLLRHKDYLVSAKAVHTLHWTVTLIEHNAEEIGALFDYGWTDNVRYIVSNEEGIDGCLSLLNIIYFADKYGYYDQIKRMGIETFMFGLTERIFRIKHSISQRFEEYIFAGLDILIRFYRNNDEGEAIEIMKKEVWKLKMNKGNIMKIHGLLINKILSVIDSKLTDKCSI